MGRLGRREEKSSASDYYRERKAGDCGHARMSRTMLPLFPGRASRSSTATFVYLRREKFSLSFSTTLRFARRWYCYDDRVGGEGGRFERNAEEIEGIEMCCGLRLIVAVFESCSKENKIQFLFVL